MFSFYKCANDNENSPGLFISNQDAKEQLSPLSATLEKLQQEKQELVERKRQKQEEGQEKVDEFSILVLFFLNI